jgi:radical SAM protein with 4Fe4S-binding SPASM domain
LSNIENKTLNQELEKVNTMGGKSNIIELRLWKLLNKFHLRNFFRQFSKRCISCNRRYSEIYVDYYIDKSNICNTCKFKAKLFSKTISVFLNLIGRGMKMPNGEFKRILKKNPLIRRLIHSFVEGIGRFGFVIPSIPAGPIVTIWTVTDRCNLNCIHCYVQKNTELNELAYERACRVIAQLYEAKNIILGFSGGEPLLREDIYDLISYAAKKPMMVAIATSGILINNSVAKKLKNSGIEYVLISVDGLEKIHDKIRVEGMFQKAINGIQQCIKEGLYVSMDVVITKLNLHQLQDLIDLALKLGVNKFEVIDFIPSEKVSNRGDLALSPFEIEKLGINLAKIWEELMTEKKRLTISWKNPVFSRILAERMSNSRVMPLFKGSYPKDVFQLYNLSVSLSKGVLRDQNPFSSCQNGCESGYYLIHIKPNGNITPCPLHPHILGNVTEHNIKNVWLNSPLLNLYRNQEFEGVCSKCVYKIICGGGCRSKIYLSTSSHIKSDPSCILNPSIKFG